MRIYHGFPVVRMARHSDGILPVCSVPCRECGQAVERTAKAVKDAIRRKRGFICKGCSNKHPSEKECAICCTVFATTWASRKRKTCGPVCERELRTASLRRTLEERRARTEALGG